MLKHNLAYFHHFSLGIQLPTQLEDVSDLDWARPAAHSQKRNENSKQSLQSWRYVAIARRTATLLLEQPSQRVNI